MEDKAFRALVIEENDGKFTRKIKSKVISDLPEGDLLIKVHYSSLNYKDALSASGNKGITRKYPHTPGIDSAGTIVHSKSKKFRENNKVIVTSYDLGMNTDGGFGQYIRVPANWAVKLPQSLSMKEAMMLGTAGLTAGISVLRLTELVKPADGSIVVSGATGGVGTMSISILKKLGYKISAITGKKEASDYLKNLGADEIIIREEFMKTSDKPMVKPAFAGGIDAVGGVILQNIIKSMHPMGVVTCCGNAASAALNLTVFPFILRGITLIGIDSQNYPKEYRERVWEKLSAGWKPENINAIVAEIKLQELNEKIDMMLSGNLKGRTLINMQ